MARSKREGWGYIGDMSTEQEVLQVIYGLVKAEKPEVVVETGTYHAHGANAIISGLRDNNKGHLWTVESHADLEYEPNDDVTFVRADSKEWARESAPDPIDFAFVDCADAEGRIEVFSALWPKVRDGGLIMVHDVEFYEDAFLEGLEEAAGQRASLVLPTLNGLAIWRKK